MSSFRSVVLISWFVLITVTASVQQQAHAQLAPAPPIVPPTDQVIAGLSGGRRELGAVGFQDRHNRFFVVGNQSTGGQIQAVLIGTDGRTIGMPQVISDTGGLCPVVTKRVALGLLAPGLGLEAFQDPPIVAWVGGNLATIMVRIVNSDGSPSGPEVVVDTSLDPEFGPNCPSLSRPIWFGRYLMTWSMLGTLRGQILDTSNPSSPLVGTPFDITETGIFSETSTAAVDFEQRTKHFLVVYAASRGGGEFGVFGQLFTEDGVLVGAAFEIAAAAGSEPVVAYSPEATEGQFLVVWEEEKFIPPPPPSPPFPVCPTVRSRIVGQRVHLAGSGLGATLSLTGGTIAIDEPTTRFCDRKGPPDIVYSLALGQNLVVWHNPTTHQVTGRLINFDGTMPREPFTISVSPITSRRGSNPRVAWSETVTPVIVSPSGEFIPNRMEYIAIWRGDLGDVRFRFVDPHLDSDGDALLDEWETGGADLNNDGQIDSINDINLVTLEPNNPPNPLRKDVYLELDWMDCAVGGCAVGDQHNHRLRDLDGNGTPEIVELMIAAFARSNVRNPDGSSGITLHVDYGQLGGGNGIADDQVNTFPLDVKAVNLDRLRRRIFRYGLLMHRNGAAAEHIPGTFFWARGGDETSLRTAIETAANFTMHELGHLLGLDHGGFDGVNRKPNYLSVMNYAFAAGIPVIRGQTPALDFSRRILLPLNESALNEQEGIGLAAGNLRTIFTCPSGFVTTRPAAGAIDWNCNNQIDRTNVTVDLNEDTGLTTLRTSPIAGDWNNLFYNLRMSGSFSSSAFVPTPDNPIPPLEDIPSPQEIHQSLAPPILEIGTESLPPVVKPGDRVSFVVKVENSGLGLAQNVTLLTKVDKQQLRTFLLGALLPGDSAKRRGSFVVPKKCVPTLTLVATVNLEDALNEEIPSVIHSQELRVICDK